MDYMKHMVEQLELHSVEGIRDCFANGVDPNDLFRGEPLIYELTSEYTRTPHFKSCVKAFVDAGLHFQDKALLAVLLDDSLMLQQLLDDDPGIVTKKYTLRCAYTPLLEASLLHVCAEFNHINCAAALVAKGADVNAVAGFDEFGFGGQTPIFHTVNQNGNNSAAMMDFLLERSADLEITVCGLIWGRGYSWETLFPAINPISYAMMGLLPQVHRDEVTISNVVSKLLQHRYQLKYEPRNVPNAYLAE